MNKTINFDIDYFEVLGVPYDASYEQIMDNYTKLYREVGQDDSYSHKTARRNFLTMAFSVLTNPDIRREYDAYRASIYNNINNSNKNVARVTQVSNNKKVANKGRNVVNNTPYAIAGGIIGASIIFSSAFVGATIINVFSKNKAASKDYKNGIEINLDEENKKVDEEIELDNKNNITIDSELSENNSNNKQESKASTDQNSFDVNSYTAIDETTNHVFAELANSSKELSVDLDKNSVEELVKYTRHSNPNYELNSVYNNELAYEDLFALAQDGVDISIFYENLDTYENIKQLYDACSKITQESNSYSDEFSAYSAMNKAVSEMHYEGNNNRNDYPEIIAIRALVDAYIDIPSMELVRDGAVENGNEGDAYYAEKELAATNSEECKAIYNKVTIENENAILTKATYKAFDENETISKTLK